MPRRAPPDPVHEQLGWKATRGLTSRVTVTLADETEQWMRALEQGHRAWLKRRGIPARGKQIGRSHIVRAALAECLHRHRHEWIAWGWVSESDLPPDVPARKLRRRENEHLPEVYPPGGQRR